MKKKKLIIKERRHGDIVILDLAGEIRLISESQESLSKFIKSLLAKGLRNFILNFARVDFVDSNGIGEIVAAFASTKHAEGTMKLCNVSDKVMLILNYTQINRLIEVFADESDAIKSIT